MVLTPEVPPRSAAGRWPSRAIAAVVRSE